MSFIRDLRVAFFSFWRTRGMALTVVLTLALGIGANAAIFTLVRGAKSCSMRVMNLCGSAPPLATPTTL